jgi:hypothetical protein
MQEIAAYVLFAAALGWLLWRWRRRRATGNCCGEPECPAAKATARRIEDAAKRR